MSAVLLAPALSAQLQGLLHAPSPEHGIVNPNHKQPAMHFRRVRQDFQVHASSCRIGFKIPRDRAAHKLMQDRQDQVQAPV